MRLLAAMSLLCAVGCSTTVYYNPDLVSRHIQQVGTPTAGKVLIYSTPKEEAYVYSGRPTTFVGSAVTAHIPFGRMTRKIAVETFDKAFSGGCVTGHSLNRPSDYEVILMPAVTEFDYHYRPKVGSMLQTVADIRMKLRGKILSPNADVLMDQVYDSNRVASDPTAGYVPKVLNKVVHTTLCDLMSQFARDVRLIVLQRSQTSPRARPAAVEPPSVPTYAPPTTSPAPSPVPPVAPHLVPESVPVPTR